MERTLIEAKYHNFLLKSNKRLMLLYGFGLLLTYPLLLFFCRNLTNVYSLKLIGQTINMLIAILGSLLIPLLMYRHTTAKNSLDVYDALPLQKESMFRIHFFAGFTILLLPLAISFVLGFIYTILNPQPEILLTSSYLMKPSVSYELIHFLEASVALLASYSIAVFTKQNCGTTIDAFIYTIVINLTPILTYLAIFSYCNATLLGFSQAFSTDFFLYLTPFPMMFNYFLNIPGIVSVPRFIFFIALSSVLYIFASQLYVNHASEKAETPFMNTRFFPVVSYIITIVSMILLYSSLQYPKLVWNNGFTQFVYPILIGCIFYLVLDVIANRGFAHILKAALNFLVIAIIVVAILIPINVTKGFGYVTRIPDRENIQSVTIQVPYVFESLLDIGGEITLTQEKEIEKIIAFHELILNEYKNYQYSTNYLRHVWNDKEILNTYPFDVDRTLIKITFEYDNKMGKMKRSYNVPLSWTKELTTLATSPSVNEARIKAWTKTEEDHIVRTFYLYDSYQRNSVSLISAAINMEYLLKLLKEDMDSLTPSEYFDSTIADFGILEVHYSDPSRFRPDYDYAASIRIKGNYHKTIEYLSQLGHEPIYPSVTNSEDTTIRLIYPNKNQKTADFHVISNGYSYFTNYKDNAYQYKEISPEVLEQLYPYMLSNAILEESGYLVVVKNEQNYDYQEYLISIKNAALIEELTTEFPLEKPVNIYELR